MSQALVPFITNSDQELALKLNQPEVQKILRGITQAKAMGALHGTGIERLIDIATNGNDREALTAIKILGQITGDLRLSVHIDHRVTFEDLRKGGSDDPLAGLFNIGASVIEAEEVDDAD